MAKKIDYASMYTLRSDGRYQGYYRDAQGKRHAVYDRDPELLYYKIAQKELPAKAAPLTFADAAERWKDKRFEELSYKSVEAYKPVFRRLTARFGEKRLDAVETRDVAAYLQFLAAQGYARRTVQLHRDMLSQIYNAAIADGLTRYNPCDHVEMPRNLAAGTRGMPDAAAIEAVKGGLDKPFGLFAFLCLYAGLRRGEALALRYEDVDRKTKRIYVRRSVVFVGNDPQLKEPKTRSGRRDVILLDVLADAIPTGKGYIFARADGSLLSKSGYEKRWQRYCDAIGHAITAHQLRHGYATMLYEAGVPDKDAQEQLGHANITLTRDVYTHVTQAQQSRTAARLNNYVEEQAQAPTGENAEAEIVKKILELLEGKNAAVILARVAAQIARSGA